MEIRTLLDSIDKLKRENEALEQQLAASASPVLFVGTADYDDEFEAGSKKILSYRLDQKVGSLELINTVEVGFAPTYLAFSPCGKFV